MLYADIFEETFTFDGSQNHEYNWNSDRIVSAARPDAEGDESDTSFGDRIIAHYWQQNWSRATDKILLFQNDGIDLSAYDTDASESEKMADIDILTGDAIAHSGDGETRNDSDGQTEIKTATAPDLTRRGRPKRQGEAGSYLADPAPAKSPDSSS